MGSLNIDGEKVLKLDGDNIVGMATKDQRKRVGLGRYLRKDYDGDSYRVYRYAEGRVIVLEEL